MVEKAQLISEVEVRQGRVFGILIKSWCLGLVLPSLSRNRMGYHEGEEIPGSFGD